jgi:hypothetical protein
LEQVDSADTESAYANKRFILIFRGNTAFSSRKLLCLHGSGKKSLPLRLDAPQSTISKTSALSQAPGK